MIVRSAAEPDTPGIEAALELVAAATGREAISEHKRLRVVAGQSLEAVAVDGDDIVGYGQAAWHGGGDDQHWAIEIVTAPIAGVAAWTMLLSELTAATPRRRHRYLWITRADDLGLARAAGWRVDRTLHEMHRALPVPFDVEVPDGVEVRPFRRHGDESAWLSAHNEAFAGHPEVGGMTSGELEMRLKQPWFDSGGLLVAWQGARAVGSCWTKLHDGAVGEIYLIGLRAKVRGIGLGRALVLLGLADLYSRQGAQDGMLWVDEANRGALDLYRELGFTSRSTIYRMTESV